MFPSFPLANQIYGTDGNAILGGYFSEKKPSLSIFANLPNLFWSKFCEVLAFPSRKFPIANRMMNIFSRGNVFKILKFVVLLIAINVINLIPIGYWPLERQHNELMNSYVQSEVSVGKAYPQVPIWLGFWAFYSPTGFAMLSFNSNNLTKITDMIHFPLRDGLPNFIHGVHPSTTFNKSQGGL